MNKIVIPTGYMGSGSSAVTDLLMGIKGFVAPHGSFEYIFMHCPNGLFDLEDKLLINNNAIRSDEALHSFRDAMEELFNNPLFWPGSYKRRLSPQFMDYVDALIDTLAHARSDNYWYHQENRGASAIPRLSAHMACKLFSKGHLSVKKPVLYDQMWLSLPTPDEFYEASKAFLKKIYIDLGIEKDNLILDQLLLPFNAWRMESYFDDNTHCVIVDRDPRDVFLLNKYIWGPIHGTPVPYPTDVRGFCAYYARMRESEKPAPPAAHVHRLHFEDLVYDYDRISKALLESLDLGAVQRNNNGASFNPEKSIENTQLFLCDSFIEEGKQIADELSRYLYDFPYERVPQKVNSF